MKRAFILIAIAALALFLRVYRVESVPPALSWDEVSIGYNAYSILKTGRDEHGKILPLDAFVSYGDYKPPLAIYLTVPFVAVLGLNETAVRLPSGVFGTLTVILMYFLVKELFRQKTINQKQKVENNFASNVLSPDLVPLITSFLLAVSPWHTNISRAGFEANIALFFVVLGVFLLFRSLRTEKLGSVAWLPFVLAIYTFNSARYAVPIVGLGFVIWKWKVIKNVLPQFIIGVVIASICLIPIAGHLTSKEARLRYAEVNIFSDIEVVKTANRRMNEDGNSLASKIFDNRRVDYARLYLIHFLDHFRPAYLFIRGDGNPKFSIQDVGQMYLLEAPFLVIGILMLMRFNLSLGFFLLFWICASIIPAASARETPHALRTLNSLPAWEIFIAFGIATVLLKINTLKTKIALPFFGTVLSILYLFSIGYYLHNYFVHYSKEYSGEWQYGYREALEFAQQSGVDYDSIYVSEKLGRAYMYTLFYTKYDPASFQKTKIDSFDASGFYHVSGFGKYIFFSDLPGTVNSNSLIIAPGTMESSYEKKETINLLNGEQVFTIYEKK